MADNKHTDRKIDNGADLYTHHVRNTPVLTRTQERELGLRAQKGDQDAQRKLVEHNQLWVLREARKYLGLGLDFEDLVQEGNFGLMRAARDYDPSRGSFITYARRWVQQYMRRAAENTGSTGQYGSKIPSYLYDVVGKVKKEKQRLSGEGEEVDPKVIAKNIDKPVTHVEAALDILERRFTSIDQQVGNDGDSSTTVGDMIPDIHTVESEAEDNEQHRILMSGLQELTDEERKFVLLRFYASDGEGGKGMKQKDVCEKLGISRSRAAYLQEQALDKLRGTLVGAGEAEPTLPA